MLECPTQNVMQADGNDEDDYPRFQPPLATMPRPWEFMLETPDKAKVLALVAEALEILPMPDSVGFSFTKNGNLFQVYVGEQGDYSFDEAESD